MTGIPDVNRSGGTSSRNQALVDQALMMNEFKGYSKYYMIGGSASGPTSAASSPTTSKGCTA